MDKQRYYYIRTRIGCGNFQTWLNYTQKLVLYTRSKSFGFYVSAVETGF